jgi:hypothetical protein
MTGNSDLMRGMMPMCDMTTDNNGEKSDFRLKSNSNARQRSFRKIWYSTADAVMKREGTKVAVSVIPSFASLHIG